MSRRDGTTTKVFVGSLPSVVTTEDLRTLFHPYGKIVECDIANRCGFLHLEDKELAEKAIEDLNNSTFMGGRISVERGRVKPPKSRRRDSDDGRGARRDRGGPYSRDEFSRGSSRNGMGYGGGRDYEYDRFGGYDRDPRGFSGEPDYGDRRPMYDDRSRGYMDDRRGLGSNGYGRSYDDRPNYTDSRRGYDDRRMPSFAAEVDDRRPPVSDHRSSGGYDRGSAASNDMYSRRGDPPLKSLGGYGDREAPYGNYGSSSAPADTYSSGGYVATSSSLGYGASGNTGTYATGSNYGTGYDGSSSGGGVQSGGQTAEGGYGSGGYGTGSGGYGASSGGYGAGSGGYGSGGGGYNSGSGTYGSGAAYGNEGGAESYGADGGQGGYGDSYGSGNRGTYDTSYSQPRSLASGAGARDRERDLHRELPGADCRY